MLWRHINTFLSLQPAFVVEQGDVREPIWILIWNMQKRRKYNATENDFHHQLNCRLSLQVMKVLFSLRSSCTPEDLRSGGDVVRCAGCLHQQPQTPKILKVPGYNPHKNSCFSHFFSKSGFWWFEFLNFPLVTKTADWFSLLLWFYDIRDTGCL